jgi:hypothetical protein
MRGYRRIVAPFALLALLGAAACGKKPEEKLLGKWKADSAALEKAAQTELSSKGLPAEAVTAAVEKVKQMAGSMTLDITAEKMVVGMGGRTHEGSWKITSAEGEKFQVHIEDTKGYKRDVTLSIVGETLSMKDPDIPVELPMVRAQ